VDEPYLREQLGRLGNTPYELAEVELDVQGRPFAPSSLLNRLRREAVEHGCRPKGAPRREQPLPYAPRLGSGYRAATVTEHLPSPHSSSGPHACTTEAAIDIRPAGITLDYLDLYGLKPSLQRVRAAGIQERVASPRVLKPGRGAHRRFPTELRLPHPGAVRRTVAPLRDRAHRDLTGDFSLNAANASSAEEFLALGLAALTPTHDLNAAQVSTWPAPSAANASKPFCTSTCRSSTPSTASSAGSCPPARATKTAAVRASVTWSRCATMPDARIPVMADVGCRNTVFGAEAQEASRHLDDWRAAGIAHFRLEFAHESGEQTEKSRASSRARWRAVCRRRNWGGNCAASRRRASQRAASTSRQGTKSFRSCSGPGLCWWPALRAVSRRRG
jgi:putative protease